MEKTVLAPELGEISSDELDTTVSSVGVVTECADHRQVSLSGLVWPEGDLETQTRTLLDHVTELVRDDLGGSMDDVTRVRWYVRSDALTTDNRATMHEVRAEFFERPHYPASTMVGVSELVHEDALVELEAEAELPDDAWETDVFPADEAT